MLTSEIDPDNLIFASLQSSSYRGSTVFVIEKVGTRKNQKYTAISRKVVGKSACDNPERSVLWVVLG